MSKTYTGAQIKPTAEVGVDVGRIVVNVGDGFYEIYVDMEIQQPALHNGQTHEYNAEPGEHRVGVYSAGRFVIDEMITVPAEEPEQPAEPEKTVSVRADVLRGLFAQAMDISACLEALLAQEDE